MMILDTLAAYARMRVEQLKKDKSLSEIKQAALELPKGDFVFEKALCTSGISIIAEIKKASPSKGLIATNFAPVAQAKAYEEAGVAAISILTEPKYFLGSDEYLKDVRQAVSLPIIRKDFTIDEYQIYEAKVLGADAVLLICSLLDVATIKYYLQLCDLLGITALVETHDAKEIAMALDAGARVIGVNNRNLQDFTVNIKNSVQLRKLIPEDKIFISESGIKTRSDIASLEEIGVDAVLIGETLMRSGNLKETIAGLRGNTNAEN
ncbi:MAG: indole-3-glycerol phosphate synthase TrpC [Acholeplasmataceae bacterium]|jgi:Indole-3-glycerol phosphate synthase|nr:indole-3-glycerol phosphate synthase TrpC [Acholeplasmataceae bacterium]